MSNYFVKGEVCAKCNPACDFPAQPEGGNVRQILIYDATLSQSLTMNSFRVEKFEGVVYQFVYIGVAGVNWTEAEKRCQNDIGGHLASIHSDTAFEFLK